MKVALKARFRAFQGALHEADTAVLRAARYRGG